MQNVYTWDTLYQDKRTWWLLVHILFQVWVEVKWERERERDDILIFMINDRRLHSLSRWSVLWSEYQMFPKMIWRLNLLRSFESNHCIRLFSPVYSQLVKLKLSFFTNIFMSAKSVPLKIVRKLWKLKCFLFYFCNSESEQIQDLVVILANIHQLGTFTAVDNNLTIGWLIDIWKRKSLESKY